MREIVFHRNAARYLAKMPGDRKAQVLAALRTLAGMLDPTIHPNVSMMAGEWAGTWRLRVGSYRAIFTFTTDAQTNAEESPQGRLEVLAIGPRGDIY